MADSDKRLYVHSVQFKSRAVDRGRLRQVLERNFGARQILIESTPTKREVKANKLPNGWRARPGSVGAKILAVLADGGVHPRAEILRSVPSKSCAATISRLVDIGAIISPAWGHYAKAGVDVSNFEKPDFGRLGPALMRMLEALDQPRTPIELKEMLGGTRQAIEQKLSKLRRRKLIKRVDALGERGRHVYLRDDNRSEQNLFKRAPALRDAAVRLLSSLPQDASTRLVDVIGTGSEAVGKRRILRSLVRQGLIEWSGTRNRRIVRLTNLGREHPQYDAAASKAVALRDTIVPTNALRLLLGIHALGEARSIDLTLALNQRPSKKGGGTGQKIQWLESVGLIETVGSAVGRQPHYRLTAAGLSHVATMRGEIEFPDPVALRTNLERERKRYVEEQKARAVLPEFRGSGRLQSILDALKLHGPLETTAINRHLPDPYGDPLSVNLAMRTLLSRGEVVVLRHHYKNKPILWGLPPATPPGQDTGPLNAPLTAVSPE